MGQTLTIAARLACPHQGTVLVTPAHGAAAAGGALVARATDGYAVTGCTASTTCATVQWTVPDLSVRVRGGPTLSTSSVGVCLTGAGSPNGPVSILPAQTAVRTR